ncbi:MAG: hypothetical protein U0J65_02005, partial [Christensenellales bacterium]|nr:hypothetical protein [Christensenellales bacterium]
HRGGEPEAGVNEATVWPQSRLDRAPSRRERRLPYAHQIMNIQTPKWIRMLHFPSQNDIGSHSVTTDAEKHILRKRLPADSVLTLDAYHLFQKYHDPSLPFVMILCYNTGSFFAKPFPFGMRRNVRFSRRQPASPYTKGDYTMPLLICTGILLLLFLLEVVWYWTGVAAKEQDVLRYQRIEHPRRLTSDHYLDMLG